MKEKSFKTSNIMNDNQKKHLVDISFCIPVYNAEKYLKSCIDSIIKIKNITFEIVCVDDKSTDSSYFILCNYAKKYPFVKIIKNNQNRGVSYCRNKALKLSKGKYIWFVDSDDIIIPETATILYNAVVNENAEFGWGNYIKICDDIPHTNSFKDFNTNDYKVITNSRRYNTPELLPNYNGDIMCSVWAGPYSSSFLKKHNITFANDIHMCEDVVFNYFTQLYMNKMIKLDSPVYLYRVSINSLSRSYNYERKIKNYLGSIEMTNIYLDCLEKGIYNTNESNKMSNLKLLEEKIHHCKQNNLQWLATIPDNAFIKEQLVELKKLNLYPYEFRFEALKEKNLFRGFMLFMLPIELFFWLLHALYMLKNRRILKS